MLRLSTLFFFICPLLCDKNRAARMSSGEPRHKTTVSELVRECLETLFELRDAHLCKPPVVRDSATFRCSNARCETDITLSPYYGVRHHFYPILPFPPAHCTEGDLLWHGWVCHRCIQKCKNESPEYWMFWNCMESSYMLRRGYSNDGVLLSQRFTFF